MFSFLAELLATTFLGFGAIYPLLLWLSPHKLIQSGFYRFNQGNGVNNHFYWNDICLLIIIPL
jgi:hypothetical protein